MSKKSKIQIRTIDAPTNFPDINDKFIEACICGDHETVYLILDSIKDFNIDITDNFGRTALRLAVTNENLEVVEALLYKSDSHKVKDALLLSIYLGHTQVAEIILKHAQYKKFNDKKLLNDETDSFWQTPSSDDDQFSPDITPIMLASQYNRYEIVQMLLLNGDRIIKPHDFSCKCNECSNKFKFDSLRHAQSRLNAYRGLASESYISLASLDPILTAFEIGHELRLLSEREKYFKHEYLSLADKLSEYTVKLLSNVRGRDELDIVLNKTGNEDEEKFDLLARFDLALKYQEMPFVAHPNCQQKLVEIWYVGIRKMAKMNLFFTLLFYLFVAIFVPFLAFFYMIAPNTKLGRFMRQPFIKFISFLTTYIVLIILVVINSLQFAHYELNRDLFSNLYPIYLDNYTSYVNNENLVYRFETNNFYLRTSKPTYLDLTISIWILGLIINEIKQVYIDGLKNYFMSWNKLYNVFMHIFFFLSFCLKYYTMIIVTIEKNKLYDVKFWTRVNNLDKNDLHDQKEVFQTFYWLNNDRFYWFTFDPMNLSEGLFAFGTTLSFCKLCFFLPANQNLGPLQIAIGRMIYDILKFICIFLIIFCGFLFGLNNLYCYYQLEIRNKNEIEIHLNDRSENSSFINAELFFGTFDKTFLTMFWSIFLLGNSEAVEIYPFKNELTLTFGYALYGTYHVTNITILLNMRHSDTEWKFSRSKLYMQFINDGVTVPVPFNIIPMPYYLFLFVKNFIKKYKLKKDRNENAFKAVNFNKSNGNIETPQVIFNTENCPSLKIKSTIKQRSIDSGELTYRKVIERVVKRFYLHNTRDTELRESDFDDLKQEVQILKNEMLNNIKKSKLDMIKYSRVIHNGVSFLGEFVFNTMKDLKEDELDNFKIFQAYENFLVKDMEDDLKIKKCKSKVIQSAVGNKKYNSCLKTSIHHSNNENENVNNNKALKNFLKIRQNLKTIIRFSDLNEIIED